MLVTINHTGTPSVRIESHLMLAIPMDGYEVIDLQLAEKKCICILLLNRL